MPFVPCIYMGLDHKQRFFFFEGQADVRFCFVPFTTRGHQGGGQILTVPLNSELQQVVFWGWTIDWETGVMEPIGFFQCVQPRPVFQISPGAKGFWVQVPYMVVGSLGNFSQLTQDIVGCTWVYDWRIILGLQIITGLSHIGAQVRMISCSFFFPSKIAT